MPDKHEVEVRFLEEGLIMLESLRGAITEAAASLADQWMSQIAGAFPPLAPEGIAEMKGVVKVTREDLGDHGAMLFQADGGLAIKVNNREGNGKPFPAAFSPVQRFSIAHEIGHILLASLLEKQRPVLECRNGTLAHSSVERLCDMAAAELLMPKRLFIEYVGHFGLSVCSIDALCETFAVSAKNAAIRMSEAADEECLVTAWELFCPPRFAESKPFVKWISRRGELLSTKDGDKAWPLHVDRKSLIYQALVSDVVHVGFERVELGDYKGRCYLEAKRFRTSDKSFAIALVFPERTKPKASSRTARTCLS